MEMIKIMHIRQIKMLNELSEKTSDLIFGINKSIDSLCKSGLNDLELLSKLQRLKIVARSNFQSYKKNIFIDFDINLN